jgi:UDP-glucuronate 4-epimerase
MEYQLKLHKYIIIVNILVTGGAGFIGSHLCEKLLEQGHKVICLDNFDEFYSKSLKKENIKDIKEHPKFHLITGDVRDTDNLIDILSTKRIDLVVHLAGKCGAVNSLKNPMDYISFNVNGTVSVLEAMKEAEVTKIIFASSSAVYGNGPKAPFKENEAVGTPTSPYAASKQAAEVFIKMYHEMHGISAVVLRLFSIYGPRQRPDSGMYQFTKANLKNEDLAVYGEGKILRDYTYIGDAIDGINKAKDYILKNENSIFEIYNIGSSNPLDVRTIFSKIESITKVKTVLTPKKSPLGILHATHADLSLAQKVLKYTSSTSIEEGLIPTINWMKTQLAL